MLPNLKEDEYTATTDPDNPADVPVRIILVSVLGAATLLVAVLLCTCWKRKRQKDEWLGLEGMVTHKNPDENVNHLPSATPQFIANGVVTVDVIVDDVDNSKRPSSGTNTQRSLPDIPSETQVPRQDTVQYEPAGDNSSDLYATVEPPYQTAVKPVITNGSVSQHSSISQPDDSISPYARVKYNKTENPYAEVHEANAKADDQNSSDEATPSTRLLRGDNKPSTSTTTQLSPVDEPPQPAAPPRSGRSSAQSNHHLAVDISAASAVAGGIAASQELPYMTPPIVVAQTNFSGDSQDSSKGYTSITVREPIKNILAQTTSVKVLKPRDQDPHYSDDSDEMYTTIPDSNNQIYTSGSETYAQIQPPLTVAVEINPQPLDSLPAASGVVTSLSSSTITEQQQAAATMESSSSNNNNSGVTSGEGNNSAGQSQSGACKGAVQQTSSHSRQASSSSSVLNLGSPKPEKRPANSPLPPTPSGSSTTTTDSPHQLLDKPTARNLDEMYAKVHKKKLNFDDPNQAGAVGTCSTVSASVEEKSSSLDQPSSETKYVRKEHNYETLKKSPKKLSISGTDSSDPGYEKLKLKAELEVELDGAEPGYASINSGEKLSHGYESLNVSKSGDNDPNYEQLRPNTTTTNTSNELTVDGYSVINKRKLIDEKSIISSGGSSESNAKSFDEPNYESMPSESLSEPNYSLLKSDSETDPNYESVAAQNDPNYESVTQNDPNYESVKYLDVELPYERSDGVSRSSSVTTAGYERIALSASSSEPVTSSNLDGGYEKIKNSNSSGDSDSFGYEKIRSETTTTTTAAVDSDSVTGKGDYETIRAKSDEKVKIDDDIFQV